MYQCCKKCCCQNNMEGDVGPLETSCSDVQSYEENNENSCQCGFDQEMNLFPTNLSHFRVDTTLPFTFPISIIFSSCNL